MGQSQEVSLKVSQRSGLIWLSLKIFIYLFVCLFIDFYFNHLETPTGIYPEICWRSDLIWLRYIGSKNVYLFVCLFVCLYDLFVFGFNHRGISTGRCSETFVKIRLNLAEIYRILKMFVCLFIYLSVYIFVCFLF